MRVLLLLLGIYPRTAIVVGPRYISVTGRSPLSVGGEKLAPRVHELNRERFFDSQLKRLSRWGQ